MGKKTLKAKDTRKKAEIVREEKGKTCINCVKYKILQECSIGKVSTDLDCSCLNYRSIQNIQKYLNENGYSWFCLERGIMRIDW